METCLDSLPQQTFTLVVTDLGSLLGIDYAMRHPDRVEGLVLIEAAFMPAEAWYDQLTSFQKMMFWMMGSHSLARHMILDTRTMYTMFADIGVARDLGADERDAYLAPYEDRERRRVVLEGPGPTTIPRHGVSRAPGDLADIMNQNAARLAAWDGPILLVTGDPGFIVQQPAIDYARQTFHHVEIMDVGRGKHFLAEDQPEAIAAAIQRWRAQIRAPHQ